MKKIYQVTVEGEIPTKVFETINKISSNAEDGVSVDIKDLERKIRYTREDEWLFCVGSDVRIPKDVSIEFLSAFKIMFAYWDKLKESEDGKYWMFHNHATVLTDSISRLQSLSCFMSRAKGLNFEGTLEAKIYVQHSRYVPDNMNLEVITDEEAENRLLDQHKVFLEWHPITSNTQL